MNSAILTHEPFRSQRAVGPPSLPPGTQDSLPARPRRYRGWRPRRALEWVPVLLVLVVGAVSTLAAAWKPAPGPLSTRWAKEVSPKNALPEYPRPQMVRQAWLNLNGLWDYAITGREAQRPAQFEGQILVPYPVESALSGVMKPLDERSRLWYRRTIDLPRGWANQRVLLHFGAVDWEATVWVNGREIGTHRGGYDPFSFDITDALQPTGPQEVTVAVWDPTEGGQAHGKQVRKPGGIMYTSTSGIWQTVWLEPVPQVHIESLKITPQFDQSAVTLETRATAGPGKLTVKVEVLEDSHVIQSGEVSTQESDGGAAPSGLIEPRITLPVPQAKPWTPAAPFLYGLRVTLLQDGKRLDRVRGYFGMRKVALGKDALGITRILLNNQFVFQVGFLDQGFWPDGLYTAPTDAALRSDIETTKKLGMNFCRKHVKVEPDRWYYWCDKLGLLVWQDMPSGEHPTPEAKHQFERELDRLVATHYNHPCIILWVVFNEGWGQYDTPRLTEWVKRLDPTRLVDNASGWTDQKVGDVVDMHNYPGPGCPPPEDHRAAVLGEFGGLGLALPGHTWTQKSWGYQGMGDRQALTRRYVGLLRQIYALKDNPGLNAAVYTQTTDVETECNGLMTYDRAVIKPDVAAVAAANRGAYVDMNTLQPQGATERVLPGATPTRVRVRTDLTPSARGGLYVGNRAPLAPSALMKLPIGSITPRGWLRHQLELEKDGMTGRLAEISPWLRWDANAWADPRGKGKGWEELPYWLKGFGDLGYVLGDQALIQETRKWIDAALGAQRPDGWFGPEGLLTSLEGKPDLWPNMIMLNVLQSFYEYTGDPRVLPFMTRYFQWENQLPPAAFGAGYWPKIRASDNLESIYWLYNRAPAPGLLDLARKIYQHMARWDTDVINWHNVNIAQGFRAPAVYYLQGRDPRLLADTERDYRKVMNLYGQFPGGGFAGDENCRPGHTDPRQGFETCGIVEFMHSFEMLTRFSAQPIWADRCEDLAFNSLPAALTPDLKGLHYLTCANQVQLDRGNKAPEIQNEGTMFSYSPFAVYRCCQHNVSHGWPYYAEELWLATADRGLCASLYAASTVRAQVGTGVPVTITEETDYPFSDTVEFRISAAKPVRFPLTLRVPRWCEQPALSINGQAVEVDGPPLAYVSLDRRWTEGDIVRLRLPMRVVVERWPKNQNAVSVNYGPLTFSLRIDEKWQRYGTNAQWPEWEVFPASAWNYGLVLDRRNPANSFQVTHRPGPLPAQPFAPEAAPVTLTVKAREIPGWQMDRLGLVGRLQPSPVRSSEPEQTITLIPMGAARLRLSMFPTIGTGPTAHEWVAAKD